MDKVREDRWTKPVSPIMKKKEFYRRNLPHLQTPGQTFFVTWLLADGYYRLKSGKHFMKKPEVARVVADSIHFWDNKQIDLYCYCIMSNHVHAVFTVFEKNELGSPLYLQDIMKSIKNYSAKECNALLGLKGQFWHHESYDHLVRDREELHRIISYVLDNPVKAGLCKERKDWKWSYINPEYNEFM